MKICIFLAACVSLVYFAAAQGPAQHHPTLDTIGAGEYCFYSYEMVQSDLIHRTTDLGYSYIYHCESSDADAVRKLFAHIDGESITLNKKMDTRKILKKLNSRVISRSHIGDVAITYGYGPRGGRYITDGNRRINLQIAETADTLIVGRPVILGGY